MTTTLQDFKDQLSELEAKQHTLAQERGELAYDSLMGDAKATKRLATIGDDLLLVDHERAILTAAIAEGERRAAADAEAERLAIAEAKLIAAEAEMPALKELCEALDERFDTIIEDLVDEVLPRTRQMHAVGLMPNENMVVMALRQVFVCKCQATPFQLGVVAPGQRRTFAQLFASWAPNYYGDTDLQKKASAA